MELFPVATTRLTLRRFREDDLATLVAYRSDPKVAEFQDWSSIDDDEAHDFIRHHQRAEFGLPGQWFQIAIALKDTDLLIGDIGTCVKGYDPKVAEIGFTVSQGSQGKGFGSEAVNAVLRILFEQTSVERIEAITDSRNAASIGLLRSLGMKPQEKPAQVWFKGAPSTEYTFVMEKKAWLSMKS